MTSILVFLTNQPRNSEETAFGKISDVAHFCFVKKRKECCLSWRINTTTVLEIIFRDARDYKRKMY
jgi:hypothetical protein